MNKPTLAQLQAATARLATHTLEVHGIRSIGSASHLEALHMAAHRREGTPWHDDAWSIEGQENSP